MKGYLNISPKQFGKELGKIYKATYYGLAESVRATAGPLVAVYPGRDAAVLIMLLTGLYGLNDIPYFLRRRQRYVIINEATSYVANMSILFSHLTTRAKGGRFRSLRRWRSAQAAFLHNPAKAESIERNVEKLVMSQRSFTADPELVASYMGKIFSEIFAWREDHLEKELSDVGYYFGKYLFYCISYEKMDRPEKGGRYNPLAFSKYNEPAVFDTYVSSTLESLINEFMASLDKLLAGRGMDELRDAVYESMLNRHEQLTGRQ